MNPYSIIFGLVFSAALAAGGFYQGWSMRGDHEAAAQLKAKIEWDKQLAEQKKVGDALVVALEDEKRNIKTVTIEVIKEIPKYTKSYIEVPGETPKTIPPAIITFGSLGLYNRSLRPDLPITASEFAYPPGATDITKAPVDVPDILTVHAENGAKYAECRTQLNKLIDWHASNKAENPH